MGASGEFSSSATATNPNYLTYLCCPWAKPPHLQFTYFIRKRNFILFTDESAPVSIVIPLKGSTNKFAVTIGRNLSIVTWDGESTTPDNIEIIATVDEEPGKEKNQFNDGKVDSAGRLWIGTMGAVNPDGTWTPELGSLYSFVKNGKPVKHLTKLSIANGLIWNKNNTKMFYIDSPTRRVDLFDFDHITGQISESFI